MLPEHNEGSIEVSVTPSSLLPPQSSHPQMGKDTYSQIGPQQVWHSCRWYLLLGVDHLQIELKEKSEWFASQHSCHHTGNEEMRYSGKGVT